MNLSDDKLCNNSKCEFNRNGIKHKVSEHNFISKNEEFEKAQKISKYEFLVKFEQSTFWKESTGVKNGIIKNEEGLEIGQLKVRKKGIGKLEISLVDSSDNVILKSTEKSVFTSKWEIRDEQNSVLGFVKQSGSEWFLFNESKKDILKFELQKGEMIIPEGNKIVQVFRSEETKRKGLKIITEYTYNIKIFDESWHKPILLGLFFPPMIGIHRSGDGL